MKKFLLIAASAAFVLSATAATLARINRATDESKLV